MLKLNSFQRKLFAAQAHHINPIVIIGKNGLSAEVLSELDRGLSSHKLIKIKILNGDRKTRTLLFEKICCQLNAFPINHIGKILVIYRPETEEKDQYCLTEENHLTEKGS